jgi:23S rRNA-/tRNA-specific pseudouridylate synthase
VTIISAKSSATLAIGLKVKKSYKLQDGDTVHIESLERFMDGGILEECPPLDLDIRLEKEDYLVLYKAK